MGLSCITHCVQQITLKPESYYYIKSVGLYIISAFQILKPKYETYYTTLSKEESSYKCVVAFWTEAVVTQLS